MFSSNVCFYSVSADIWIWMCLVWLEFTLVCELVYDELENIFIS